MYSFLLDYSHSKFHALFSLILLLSTAYSVKYMSLYVKLLKLTLFN